MVRTSKGLAVIAVSRITNEEKDKPSPGLLLFGRVMDDAALQGVSSLLNAGSGDPFEGRADVGKRRSSARLFGRKCGLRPSPNSIP
ncbi:CHASE4 domain-containing protein [Cohnella faecalis]|uniref:CHASE4 domain-containing protein n=1 Tax=Cohnella faecalis TaxID=2315694 RepID=A0A398CPP5_9BACL|nr:CHASE4 domain-containing protein [Cohnella faecalis]RIE04513.1 hypothetical protein D3H35_05775 [Cohnella faecalis]